MIDPTNDELLMAAAELVVTRQFGSSAMLQWNLRVGYARAERLLDELAAAGVVGPRESSSAREVYVSAAGLPALLERLAKSPVPLVSPGRRGDWMQTFTGRQFWPLDPRPEEVDPTDIAHSLAYQCRYAGHSNRFYSVAEHSILLSLVVPPEYALWALLHDAAEAYVVDVPRPLKRHLPGYADIEQRVLLTIAVRFGLELHLEGGRSEVYPQAVVDADNRILLDERAALMAPPPAPWGVEHLEPLGVGIDGLPPYRAYQAFLERLTSLGVTV